MQKLNDAQRALVIEHTYLISWWLNNRMQYVTLDEWDDFYQIGALGLCKAAASFDPGRAEFATFALYCIGNEVRMFLRREKVRERERKAFRLESIVSESEDDVLTLGNTLPATEDVESGFRLIYLQDLLKRCGCAKDRMAMSLYIDGYDQTEIGRALNISQSMISRRLKRMRAAIRQEIA